jgi:hypothetical protein
MDYNKNKNVDIKFSTHDRVSGITFIRYVITFIRYVITFIRYVITFIRYNQNLKIGNFG